MTALKILSENLRWILWLICLPNIQPPQTRELSERPFFNMNTLRIVSGYVTNFHKPGNKVILLHVPESYINATTMSKWQAALSSINYMHITNIHHHRNIGSKLPQQVLSIVCIVPAGGTHNQRTNIVNIGNSQLCVTIYKCLHPSSSFSIPEKKEEICSWYDVRNITGLIRFQLIKTKFGVICMNVCQSKLTYRPFSVFSACR